MPDAPTKPGASRPPVAEHGGPGGWRVAKLPRSEAPDGEAEDTLRDAEVTLRTPKDTPPRSANDAKEKYAVGDRIAGKYQLVKRLEAGGMGVVWAAQNLALDAPVALKFIRYEEGYPPAKERLDREARAAARLDHPAIIRVFDLDRTAAGAPFIAMELLEGESLARWLTRQDSIDAITAVRVLLPIADALATLHARAIVHRDLKPHNIFVARRDSGRLQPKLLDFGIAWLEGSKLTVHGTVLGSPEYLSPEQAQGLAIDHRTDVWGFCVVLYEAVTGYKPFAGEDGWRLFHAILEGEPTPITRLGVDDPALWEILARGLRKAPAERWSSMRELGEALAAWLAERGVNDDVCGVSLVSTWPRSARATSPSLPRPSGLPPSRPSPLAAPSLAAAPSSPRAPAARSSGSWRFALAVGALLLAATVAWWRARSSPAAEVRASAPSSAALVAAAIPPPSSVVTAAPEPSAAPPASVAIASSAAPSRVSSPQAPAKARPSSSGLKDPFAPELKDPFQNH